MGVLTIAATLLAYSSFAFARQCQNITIPVNVSARNGVFGLAAPATNIDVVNFALNLARQGHNYSQELLTGYATVGGSYDIAATFCMPDHGCSKDSIVQLCTHGVGFDRSYWDLSYNNYENSYVATAVDQYGFSTLTYDRLGIGMSSHGEPINEIQAPLEVVVMHTLNAMLRAGEIPGVDTKFSKVVQVGHSFGSAQSFGLTLNYPSDPDAVVLTGFSLNSSFIGEFIGGADFISANQIPAFSEYPNGYFASSTIGAVQWNFFAPGQFDSALLEIAYKTGQPVTAGELLTIGGGAGSINPYTGPVLVVTGDRDIPFCGGDCQATGIPSLPSIPDAVSKFYPSASAFEAYIVPEAGHGINLQYSAQLAYHVIQEYLLAHGLVPEKTIG